MGRAKVAHACDRVNSRYRDPIRLSATRKIGNGETAIERPLTGATVNRALALLRHLLRLAHDEWELLEVAL